MKNPLRKRYIRDLKQDCGKYLVIFLFIIMLISLVSGYLVAADSIEKTFYEGYEKYNIEDGHISFNRVPDETILQEIAQKGKLKLYPLNYVEEQVSGKEATLRIYKNRVEIDRVCLMSGTEAVSDDQVVLDRVFANNNQLAIGDTITLNGKQYTICGLIAAVDYGCLFQNNSDMMFNSINFGVGMMSDAGYERLNSIRETINYAWNYETRPVDDKDENTRSEALIDDLEDIIKAYDTAIAQAQVDNLYDQAEAYSEDLRKQFEDVSTIIEGKVTEGYEALGQQVQEILSPEELMASVIAEDTPEMMLEKAAKKKNTTVEGLLAEELGTTEKAYRELLDAMEDFDEESGEVEISERPTINLDDVDEEYENEMDFSLDEIRDMVSKIEATGLADVTKIQEDLDGLEELLNYEFDDSEFLTVENYLPRYENKAIHYCMDDMGSDKPMFIIFAYIVTLILAFVFAVTISNTIAKEAGVIGTLRASGYKKTEMVVHYLFLPMLVALLAAVVGNVLGYTVFVELMKGVFYNSFSLATYKSVFNTEAFLITTVVPMLIMVFINLFVLTDKLKLSPIRFLRHDLAKKKKRRAILLNKKIPFIHRFRIRILFQNLPAYCVLFVGIFIGGVIAVFGWMFGPMLDDYAEMIKESRIANYQYVLMDQIETETIGAEKYCISALETMNPKFMTDEISIYGILEDSTYIGTKIPEGKVLVSEGILEKYQLKVGDVFTLKDPYSDKNYDFTIAGSYRYDAALAIFMNRKEFNTTFEKEEDYFTGYFSQEEIADIEKDDVATVITIKDLTKVSDQMQVSMGAFMALFQYFGVAMFLLLMYLMTKQIIEKNMQSIAMTKILGFRDGEIAGLYLVITSIVCLASLFISIPLIDGFLRLVFQEFLYTEITGYIPYIINYSCYVKLVVTGAVCYAVICLAMMWKIGRIPKSEALKNVE